MKNTPRIDMTKRLSSYEEEVFARKEASRQRDRETVESGTMTWDEMNRANSLAASIIQHYKPRKRLGFPYMPTYEYKCEKCEQSFEVEQKITDPVLTECANEECRGPVQRLVSKGSGFQLKGGGWYKDGY